MPSLSERLNSKFDEALKILQEEDVPTTRDIIKRSSGRIQVGDIPILGGLFPITYTDFMLIEFDIEGTNQQGVGPGILLDSAWVDLGSPLRIAADLVRTLAVLDQYPTSGFERRMTLVYGDALQAQRLWLEAINAPKVNLDPRRENPREITRTLLGNERFYTDTGLADVYNAINNLRPHEDPEIDRKLAEMVLMDAKMFIGLRHQIRPTMRQTGEQIYRKGYTRNLTPDQRAEACANAILLTTALQEP